MRGGVTETTDSDSGDIDSTEPVETERDRLDELGEKNFDGRTFTILDANDHPDMWVNMPGESENGDIINDALYRRDIDIEGRYNIDIQYIKETSANNGVAMLKNSVFANDDEYSLCISHTLERTLGSAALDGVLANLNDMPYLSLGENWWSGLIYDSLRFDEKMYFTTGDISPAMYQMPACIYLNTDLAADYNINDDFPQMVRDGKWTWDVLIERTKDLNRDLNDDGRMTTADDFCGFASLNDVGDATSNAWLTSCGVKLSTISDNGSSISVDIMNEQTLSAIDKIKMAITPELKCNATEFDDLITLMFKGDRAIFMQHFVQSAVAYLRDMNSDYIILPFPKYDEAQDGYRSFCNPWVCAFVAAPETADKEFVGFVTEALGYYSYKHVRPQTYGLMLKQKAARDEDSTEMLDYIFDSLYIDFNCVYNFGGSLAMLLNVTSGKGDIASSYAQIEDKIEADIEKFIENWNN